jgi:hypothetical protein
VALLIGGEQYLRRQGNHPNAIATQSALASTHQTQTTVANLGLKTCTAALAIGDDATCVPPPPPSFKGTMVLNAPSPDCLPSGVAWRLYNNTNTACSTTDGIELIATTFGTLGCLEATSVTTSNGYASVFVTQGTGSPVLVFRQGLRSSIGTTVVTSTGYFFKVMVTGKVDQFIFYRYDGTGSRTIQTGQIPGQLAAHYVMSVLYIGSTFTLYINGQMIDTETDPGTPAISSGWYGLCVDEGTASFRSAQNQNTAG